MELGTWILLAGVVVASLGVIVGGVTGIAVVARFIFRLDAKVDRLDTKVDRLAEDMSELKTYVRDIAASLASLVERTAKLEGRVNDLSRDKRH